MSSPAASEQAQREELSRLQAELASRASTVHFARAGVSTLAAMILLGVTTKMVLDAGKLWILPLATGVATVGLLAYALIQGLKGRVSYRVERERFERMMALRGVLGLDDPDALLPQR